MVITNEEIFARKELRSRYPAYYLVIDKKTKEITFEGYIDDYVAEYGWPMPEWDDKMEENLVHFFGKLAEDDPVDNHVYKRLSE